MAERAGLLNRYTSLNLYRGFESLPLRKLKSRSALVFDEGIFHFRGAGQARLPERTGNEKSARSAALLFFSLTPSPWDHRSGRPGRGGNQLEDVIDFCGSEMDIPS